MMTSNTIIGKLYSLVRKQLKVCIGTLVMALVVLSRVAGLQVDVISRAKRAEAAARLHEKVAKDKRSAEAMLAKQRLRREQVLRDLNKERLLITNLNEKKYAMEKLRASIQPTQKALPNENLESKLKIAEEKYKENAKRAEELRSKVEQEQTFQKNVQMREAQADKAQKQQNDPETKEKRDLIIRIAQAKLALKALETELEKLRSEIEVAQKELSNAEASVTVPSIPGPNGAKLHPVYIECHTSGITIYKLDGTSDVDITLDNISKSQEISSLAEVIATEAKSDASRVVNVLVRPEGVKAYDRVSAVLSKAKAPWSSVPIRTTGKLKFLVSPIPTGM